MWERDGKSWPSPTGSLPGIKSAARTLSLDNGFFFMGVFYAAQQNPPGGLARRLCCVYRHWHGRAGTRPVRGVAGGIPGHYRSDGFSLSDLELPLSVSQRLAGRSLGTQADDAAKPAGSSSALAALFVYFRSRVLCRPAFCRGHSRRRLSPLGPRPDYRLDSTGEARRGFWRLRLFL